jgi:hypothetical protein
MQTFIAVCSGLIVIELGIGIAAFVLLALALRQAVRAFEMLAYRVDEEVEHVSAVMKSSWMKSLQAAAGIISGMWFGRNRE